VPGAQRQVVFTYKKELDAWLKQDSSTDKLASDLAKSADAAASDSNADADHDGQLHQRRSGSDSADGRPGDALPSIRRDAAAPDKKTEVARPLFPSLAGVITQRKLWRLACFAAVLGVIWFGYRFLMAPTIRILSDRKLTDDGHAKGSLVTDGKTLYFVEYKAGRSVLAYASVEGGPVRNIETPFSNVGLQDLSADGQRLLLTSFEGFEKSGNPLWILSLQGANLRRVGDILCDSARWSPYNRQIACARGASIYLLDDQGVPFHTVGPFPMIPRNLLWSPDANYLRFTLCDDYERKCIPWELSIETRQALRLNLPKGAAPNTYCCAAWFWTRDGRDFLYTTPGPAGHAVLFIEHQGWQEAEAKIAMLAAIGDLVPGKSNHQFYALVGGELLGQLLKFDSKAQAFQAFMPGLSADTLSFSPDGKWIAYRKRPEMTFWRSRLDGSEAIPIAPPAVEPEYSAWSPDGRKIAVMAHISGEPWRIFLIDSDGKTISEASNGTDDQGAPTWSPDGKTIVYGNVGCERTQSCWIRLIHVATGEEERLPGSYGFRTARWSPDGKFILAMQNETHQVMLFDVHTRRWKVLADGITGDAPNWSSDSRYIFVETLLDNKPIIKRIRVSDGKSSVFVDLAILQNSFSGLDPTISLAPDQSLIFFQSSTPVDVYALEWTVR